MNYDQAQEYMAAQASHRLKHGELLAEYTEPQFHLRGTNETLETALTAEGDYLAYNPPLQEVDGEWKPKSKGLKHGRFTDLPLLTLPMGEVIPVDQWAQYLADREEPPSVKAFVLGVKDQNGYGSCTCEGGTAGVETVNNFAGRTAGPYNPLFTYGLVNGGSDSGSSLEDVIASLQTTGACPEAVWPRSKGWRAKPPKEAFDAAANNKLAEVYSCRNKAEFGTALIQRKGIHLWYDSHSIWAVSLLSATQFEYLNSWGSDWGNNGYGTMALSSLSYNGFYVYGSTQLPIEV